MKITSQVHAIGGSSLSHPSDASVYLFASGGEGAVIDAGTGLGHAQVIENIKKVLPDLSSIRYLFITHCHYDHTGGANALRRATGCALVAHEEGRWFLESGDSEVTAASWYGSVMPPTPVDIGVDGPSRSFTVGDSELVFHHTPGHSPDSSVITVRSDGKLVLFGQDVHGPLHDQLRSVRSDYQAMLRFLLSLEADILCEGHFGVFTERDRVKKFISSFLD